MNSKITIGLPFFNNEKTLSLAIKSVLFQTYKDWELLLIDDGSTDNSLEIASKFAEVEKKIFLLSDGTNKGLVFRLNQIIDISNTDFIARMDADDIMLPNRLEKQISIFMDNPKIDVVATAAFTIDENNNPIGIRDMNDLDIENYNNILKKSFIIHPSILVKKDWYKSNKYNEIYLRAEDYELWCRTYNHTNFFKIKEPLLLYREGSVNVNNYLLSMNTLKVILNTYSKDLLSKRELAFEIFKINMKIILYSLMGTFNLQFVLSNLRSKRLTAEQSSFVKVFILKLKNFNL